MRGASNIWFYLVLNMWGEIYKLTDIQRLLLCIEIISDLIMKQFLNNPTGVKTTLRPWWWLSCKVGKKALFIHAVKFD